jgi:hypothetical protein
LSKSVRCCAAVSWLNETAKIAEKSAGKNFRIAVS